METSKFKVWGRMTDFSRFPSHFTWDPVWCSWNLWAVLWVSPYAWLRTLKLKKRKKKEEKKNHPLCFQVAHKNGKPWVQMPKIRQTERNIVNWGLPQVPSEYLRMERITLLWSKDLQQDLSSVDQLAENLTPHRRVIIEERTGTASEWQVTVCGRVVVCFGSVLKGQ